MGILTDDHLARFGREGYLVLRDAVPEALVAAANREVDSLVASRSPDHDGTDHDATFWFPPIAGHPACHDLLRTELVTAAIHELVAPHPVTSGPDDLFQERGTRVLTAPDAWGHPALLDPPLLPGPALELMLAPGDVLLAHHLLGRNKAGNTTATTRRTVYFHLHAPGHRERQDQPFLDPWTEYEPVRRALR